MSRANLREGVIWVRPEGDEHQETTQEMADDYVRMACAEIKFMTVPESSGEQELNKTLLVVGGGVTGMTAAIEAARPATRSTWCATSRRWAESGRSSTSASPSAPPPPT